MTPQHYWLGLTLIQGIGPARLRQLLGFFSSAERAWHATEAELRQTGLPEVPLQRFVQGRAKINLSAEMEKVHRAGAHVITLEDENYPARLRQLEDAPVLLYVRGQLLPEDELALAVIGTRSASRYGRDAAHYLAKQLASRRITIVSGLALGIDSAAHRGALDAGGRTIAVLGCGIHTIYPRQNQALAGDILKNGAIITEYATGVPPAASNFPRRNRILSGLARGVLVVEAPEHSGTQSTVRAALEQGRDVFAVPSNIFNPQGTGTNRLIQEGAKLVMTAQDVLEELNMNIGKIETRQRIQQIVPVEDKEQTILNLLEADPIHIDEIIRASGLPAGEVAATLMILELKGLAQSSSPMQYCRTR